MSRKNFLDSSSLRLATVVRFAADCITKYGIPRQKFKITQIALTTGNLLTKYLHYASRWGNENSDPLAPRLNRPCLIGHQRSYCCILSAKRQRYKKCFVSVNQHRKPADCALKFQSAFTEYYHYKLQTCGHICAFAVICQCNSATHRSVKS